MPTAKKYKDFESALNRLEEITELMESDEARLEQSIELYTEGLQIAKFCNEKLSEAETKIKIIAENAGLTVEEDFDSEPSEDET